MKHDRLNFRKFYLLGVFLLSGCLSGDNGFKDLISGSIDDVDELTIETVLPDVSSVIIQQGQSQSFYATIKTPVGRTSIMTWKLDGAEVATGATYSITATPSNVGTKDLILSVTDGVHTKTRAWEVKINGPPVLTAITAGVPKVAVGSTIPIEVSAVDPNGDSLTYTWKINGAPSAHLVGVTGTGQAQLTGHIDLVGSMNLSVEVSDGSATDSYTWTAEVNYFPQACNELEFGEICTISGTPSIGDNTQPGISPIELKIKPISHSQDALGNLFLVDYQSNIIWYWNKTSSSVFRLGQMIPANTIKVVAGSGEAGTGPDGVATESALNNPRAIVYDDANSRLYIAEYSSSRVRWVDNNGYIYTGMGGGSSHVDGVSAYSHSCSNAAGLALYNDSLYVTCRNSHRVKRWDLSTDLAYTVVGEGSNSFGAGPAASTPANRPHNIYVNSMGIFVAHREVHRISFTNHSGAPITFWSGGGTITVNDGHVATIVGTGVIGTDTNTNATAGNIGDPTGLVYMNDVLYFTQLNGEYLYAVNNTGSDFTIDGITVAAGKLVRLTNGGTYNGSGVRVSLAKMYDPYDLTVDVLNPGTRLLVSDYNNNRLREIDLVTEKINDVLGSGKTRNGFYGHTQKPTYEHLFNYVTGVAFDNTSRQLFFTDASNYVIRSTDAYGRTETALSAGAGDPTVDNDVPSNSRLRVNWNANWYLSGLDLLPNRSMLIANSGSNNVRFWNRSGASGTFFDVFLQDDRVSNLAGDYLTPGNGGDGPALSISLQNPTSAKYNPVDGKVYIVDHRNHCIRSLGTDGVLTRVLGTCGTSGTSLNDVAAASLEMNLPTDIAFDSLGNLLITDRGNHRVRYWNKTASAVTIAGVTIDPGRVSIIACLNGNAASGSLNEGILATSVRCNNPTGIAVNSSNICFANMSYHNVRCISLANDATNGRIYTRAGTPPSIARAGSPVGFEQEGISGTAATLYNPTGVAFDANGDLYIGDSSNHIVRKVKLSP